MSSRLYLQERRDQIVALLDRNGRVSVTDLSERFGLSRATIRADLDALDRQGFIIRAHGGAISTEHSNAELSFEIRRNLHTAEKRRIGAAAVAMIEDGEAIALDGSTTALAIADQLNGRRELTVITNGINIALALLHASGITVLMPGGFLRRDSVSLVGIDGRDLIERYHFEKGFFGAKGFTLDEGLTDVNRDEVAVKRDLMQRAKRVVAIVDSSKWGRVGFVSFASVEQIDIVITDAGAPQDMVDALSEAGVRVVVA